jgi:hypothetical protein
VTGNAGLPHAQNLLQLGHGKFLFLEQKEQAQASRIGQQPQ